MYPMLPDSSVEGICSNRRRTSANTSKHMSMPRIGMSVFLAIQVLIHVRDAQHGACCNGLRLKTHMFAVESTWHLESKMGCWFLVRFKGRASQRAVPNARKPAWQKKMPESYKQPATLPQEKKPPHYPFGWVESWLHVETSAKTQHALFQVDGCSINPNRSLGPALVSKLRGDFSAIEAWEVCWIRWLGLHLKVLVGANWCMLSWRVNFMCSADIFGTILSAYVFIYSCS